jgi:hypothetical protein
MQRASGPQRCSARGTLRDRRCNDGAVRRTHLFRLAARISNMMRMARQTQEIIPELNREIDLRLDFQKIGNLRVAFSGERCGRTGTTVRCTHLRGSRRVIDIYAEDQSLDHRINDALQQYVSIY